MTDQVAAHRYAQALFGVSLAAGDLDRSARDLASFQALLDEHADLGRVLTNPAIPPSRKHAIVGAVLKRIPEISPIVRRLLLMLAERGRLGLLPAVIDVFRARRLDHLGVVRARITTAAPIGTARVASITRTIETALGRPVEMQTAVDPRVLGGMVTRIGNTVFDGSVAHHLARLRQRFTTAQEAR